MIIFIVILLVLALKLMAGARAGVVAGQEADRPQPRNVGSLEMQSATAATQRPP